METQALLCLRGIQKVYQVGDQEVRALDGVDLDIAQGEFVAVIGASGSGKSTLLNIIGCLDSPTAGSYTLDGLDVSKLDQSEQTYVRNQQIGFVFQGYNLLPPTTVPKNKNRPLTKVGLGDRLSPLSSELAGGQQQRVAIARALTMSLPLLLADEPPGHLATRQSEEIMAIFQRINDEGRTLMMVTHEPEIAQFCKRIVVFHDGKIIDDRPVTRRRMVLAPPGNGTQVTPMFPSRNQGERPCSAGAGRQAPPQRESRS